MSAYQYYEFKAIDRALTRDEMAALRAISARDVITSTSITNHYEWGDFLGIHQLDKSNLPNGRVSKFSMSKLIKFAGKLNLGTQVKLTKPKAPKLSSVATAGKAQKRIPALASV